MLRSRIEVLQQAKRPFFLTTLTLSSHHPFTVPLTSPEVRALQAEPDGYVAALRYVDQEFERFFTELQRRDPGHRRFENPHIYPVGLSPYLNRLRDGMIAEARAGLDNGGG